MRIAPLCFALVCATGVVAARGAMPELADSVDSVADLALDSTFGEGGVVSSVAAAGGQLDTLWFVDLDNAGRIVVAGTRIMPDGEGFQESPGAARFFGDGTLDTSFGDGGVLVLPMAGILDGMTLGESGRIVLCGRFRRTPIESGSVPYGLVALDENGALDSGFSDDGLVELPDTIGRLQGVQTGPAGTLFAAAWMWQGGTRIVRILPDGDLDTGYAGLITDEGNSLGVSDIAVDSHGRVVTASGGAFFAFDEAGLRDPAFGSDGWLVGIEGGRLEGSTVEIDAQDRIVVYAYESGHRHGFFRLLPNGRPDPLFAGEGLASRPLGIPANVNVDPLILGVAPGDTDRYVVVTTAVFPGAIPGEPAGRGWFAGAFDPARARSVASLTYRDPDNSGAVLQSSVRDVAVSADGAFAVAVGYTQRVGGDWAPILARIDLVHETPRPVANLRPSWAGPVFASGSRRTYQLSSTLRVRNTGHGDVGTAQVWVYMTKSRSSDEPGYGFPIVHVGPIAAEGEVSVPIQVDLLDTGLSRRELRRRKLVAVVDTRADIPQSDTSDDVAVSDPIQPLRPRRRR